MTTLWFIRHAESKTNIGLPTSKPLTIQLSSKGFEQAQQIAHAFDQRPDLIITSPYVRSMQTAFPLLQRFPYICYEEWPVHEFTYLAQSLNKKRTTQMERSILVNEYWSHLDPYYKDGERAESFVDFMNRVWQVLERLKNSEKEFIVIFTHGQFILAVLSWLMGLILDDMQQFRYFLLANKIPNGAILKVQLQRENKTWFSAFSTCHLSSISYQNLAPASDPEQTGNLKALQP